MALASQTGLFARAPVSVEPAAEDDTHTAYIEAAPALPADPTPAAQADIVRLTSLLAEREDAYAKALVTLGNRDNENSRLTAVLAERDGELTNLRTELTQLRTELENLRSEVALAAKTAATVDPTLAAPTEAEFTPSAPSTAEIQSDSRPDSLTAVHFDPSSARLSPGGQAHAAAAAVMLSEMKIARIKVIGYTDSTGSPRRNRALAEARARAVADFLIRAGLPADVIEIEGMGEEGAPVITADGVTEPLNRCAEIVAIPL